MTPRDRVLIAVVFFIIGGVLLTYYLQPTYLPQTSPAVGNDDSHPDVAAVLAKNPDFTGYVLLGAKYFSCDTGGYGTTNGVPFYTYYGFIWGSSGNFIVTYEVSVDASGKITQFATYPFMSAEPEPLPQMQYWTVYSFSTGYILLNAWLMVAAVIMIIIAVLFSIQSIVAYSKKNPSLRPSDANRHIHLLKSANNNSSVSYSTSGKRSFQQFVGVLNARYARKLKLIIGSYFAIGSALGITYFGFMEAAYLNIGSTILNTFFNSQALVVLYFAFLPWYYPILLLLLDLNANNVLAISVTDPGLLSFESLVILLAVFALSVYFMRKTLRSKTLSKVNGIQSSATT